MRKSSYAVALCLASLLSAGESSPQCIIGVYGDQAGTVSAIAPQEYVPFDIYVVLRDEAAVEGIAYSITFPVDVFSTNVWYGPDEAGFGFLTPNGVIVGFGACAIGFGGESIQVAKYETIAARSDLGDREVHLAPNTDEDPTNIVYATCSGQVIPCETVLPLLIGHVDPVYSTSFGALKSLF